MQAPRQHGLIKAQTSTKLEPELREWYEALAFSKGRTLSYQIAVTLEQMRHLAEEGKRDPE